jgi:hypothetical protein
MGKNIHHFNEPSTLYQYRSPTMAIMSEACVDSNSGFEDDLTSIQAKQFESRSTISGMMQVDLETTGDEEGNTSQLHDSSMTAPQA